MALMMLKRMKFLPLHDLKMRIGCHSGSVVSGVIGTQKFKFGPLYLPHTAFVVTFV